MVLESKSNPAIPDRPYFNEEMVEELAKIVAPILQKYNPHYKYEGCLEDAKSVLEYDWSSDGYALAKEFEEEGYSASSSLVDDLDVISSEGRDILEQAEKKWVADHKIILPLKVGDKVIFDAWKKNNEEGEIMRLYPYTAQYGIWCESIGKPKGTSCYVIDFEKIKSVI